MIGFISAISACLAIITLVVISSLIGYIQSITPSKGLIKIDDSKYRYIMEGKFVSDDLIKTVLLEIESIDLSSRVISYQTGCSYGFNTNKREVEEVSTYNYLILSQYFSGSISIDTTNNFEADEVINTCYIDINLRPEFKEVNNER